MWSFTIDNITKSQVGCQLGYVKTNVLCYADDMVIMSPTLDGLQLLVDQAAEMFSSLCLQVNFDKCDYVIHRARTRNLSPLTIHI